MLKIKNFAIFKNDKATGNQPGYRMVGKDDKGNKYQLGVLWLKESNGQKYYSGVMKDEFTKDDGTKYDGFTIVKDADLENDDLNTIDYPQDDDVNDVDF